MNGVSELVRRAESLGAKFYVQGEYVEVDAPTDFPAALVGELRRHKTEVLAYLARPADAPPEWHAEEIERRVKRDGLCLFWSHLFGEAVAFIADESFRAQVPAGVVSYTVEECELLCKSDPVSENALKLIHQAKKLSGGTVRHNEPE